LIDNSTPYFLMPCS